MIRVVSLARRRSDLHDRPASARAPKNPSKTCPWKTCTRTGTPAITAARRPSVPALAVCVSTMSGRQRRNRYISLASAITSSRGRISRPSSGTINGCTPRVAHRREHAGLALPLHAGDDELLEPLGIEAGGQLGDVHRDAAHVEPGDDPADPDVAPPSARTRAPVRSSAFHVCRPHALTEHLCH